MRAALSSFSSFFFPSPAHSKKKLALEMEKDGKNNSPRAGRSSSADEFFDSRRASEVSDEAFSSPQHPGGPSRLNEDDVTFPGAKQALAKNICHRRFKASSDGGTVKIRRFMIVFRTVVEASTGVKCNIESDLFSRSWRRLFQTRAGSFDRRKFVRRAPQQKAKIECRLSAAEAADCATWLLLLVRFPQAGQRETRPRWDFS